MNSSFKDALISKADISFPVPNPQVLSPKSQKINKNKTIFFTDFKEETQAKDLWKFFKTEGNIRDIKLPRKKDKFNIRFGFLTKSNYGEAMRLVKKLNGVKFGESRIFFAMAKENKRDKAGLKEEKEMIVR